MKKTKKLMTGLFVFLFFTSLYSEKNSAHHEKKLCDLKGEYLGQPKPGLTPQVFALGIISTDGVEHGSLVFSPDGQEIYWSRVSKDFRKGAIWNLKQEKGKWSAPQIASFSNENSRDLCPVLSPDGKRLFFTSRRPINGQAGYNLWVSQKINNSWSRPRPLNEKINKGFQSGCTLDKNNNLYYMSFNDQNPPACDIFISNWEGGDYQDPKLLSNAINTKYIETTPFISPDNTYLLFSSQNRSDGTGGFDLYVSFKKPDGSWTRAVNMGSKINTGKNEWFPSLSPDGKYIFFISNKAGSDDYYWVDSNIINELKPG